MVLVDTSVWADFFNGTVNPETKELLSLLQSNDEEIFFTGLILQEVLQGIHAQSKRKTIQADFENLVYIQPTLQTHIEAAEIFSTCRRKGITIRKSIDTVLATMAMEYDLEILHRDRDFTHIANAFPLMIRQCACSIPQTVFI